MALVVQTWTLAGEHWVMAEFSREKKLSISSREHEVGSARKSVAESEAFATASSAEEAMMRRLLSRELALIDSKIGECWVVFDVLKGTIVSLVLLAVVVTRLSHRKFYLETTLTLL